MIGTINPTLPMQRATPKLFKILCVQNYTEHDSSEHILVERIVILSVHAAKAGINAAA